MVAHAIGGIDLALWDIAGKYYKQPVYQLLGGAFSKRIRAYASDLFGRDGNETREKGKKWVDQGFTAVKFGWAPMGQSEKMDLELVEDFLVVVLAVEVVGAGNKIKSGIL